MRTIFEHEYNVRRWGQGSGIGSLPERNIEYRVFLERFIEINNVQSVVDLGCGQYRPLDITKSPFNVNATALLRYTAARPGDMDYDEKTVYLLRG